MEHSVYTAFADSLIVPQCVYRPGSFTGLMTIYESNYMKFRQLVGDLSFMDTPWVSSVADDCDLYLECKRREPYTTTLQLTYWFEEGEAECIADPDLTVRLYHDARLAEARGVCTSHRHAVLRALANGHSVELDRRWHSNIMLNKWLDYLLETGHRFRREPAAQEVARAAMQP